MEGRLKSRSLRKVDVRTPGSKLVMHVYRRKPAKAQCASCGEYLKGVARAHASELQNMSLTKKRPQRAYGGVLCSRCSRQTIVDKFRNVFKIK